MLGLVWQTPVGTALVLRVAGLALVLVGLWSFSGVGHVADAAQFWLEFLLLLHLAGAAFWIGILSPLRTIASDRESLSLAAGLGHRFGRIAAFTVPVLIATGIVMAWRLLGDVAALVARGYGLTLLAKIGAVACLLATAVANKLRFVPAMRNGDRMAAVGLRRSIAVEWAAVGFILMATAVLTTVPDLPSGGKP